MTLTNFAGLPRCTPAEEALKERYSNIANVLVLVVILTAVWVLRTIFVSKQKKFHKILLSALTVITAGTICIGIALYAVLESPWCN